MSIPPQSVVQAAYQRWLSAARTLLAKQWELLGAQCLAGFDVVQAALDTQPNPGPTVDVRDLERRAAERASKGLAPPREIYQMPYRAQIDWARFPEWARPSDPEMFEGGHEG